VNNKVIQPLHLNVERFKREYKRLSTMTTFTRAMDKAIDIKADKWMAYTPLSKAQLFDTPHLEKPIAILRPMASGNIAPARSSYRAGMLENISVFKRPTEALAILSALGFFVLPSDFEVWRQENSDEMRWCILCKRTHKVSEFAANKHFPNGLSFACKRSLGGNNGGFWERTG
jgi:hypothetical protein